jgi:hypothetical protein
MKDRIHTCIQNITDSHVLADRVLVGHGIQNITYFHVFADRVLVGHGIYNDLKLLGVEHPSKLLRDTINCPLFQRNGYAQSLKLLALQHLDLNIQRRSAVHSAK